MTRTILIGKARRITLDELASIATGSAKLEMQQQQTDEEAAEQPQSMADVASALQKLSLDTSSSGDLLSAEATIASLTLLALTISQGRIIRGDCAAKLSSAIVDIVNNVLEGGSGEPLRLPSNADGFTTSVNELVGGELAILENGPYLERLISIARISLCLNKARTLSSKSISDPIASLSIERLGSALSIDSFSSTNYDELRPHRGCIESASVIRACLQGSTNVAANEKNVTPSSDDSCKYAKLTPQYHGPARESITGACKTMELEMNCSEMNGSASLDDTVAMLAAKSVLESVLTLSTGSSMRCGSKTDTTQALSAMCNLAEVAPSLETAVVTLQNSLESEAKMGCVFVDDELAKKEAELKAKEEEKAKRTAARGTNNNPNASGGDGKDEFAGMSEAQKAKILKKRAEKEAKAAAKAKAKKAKAAGGAAALTSIFGAGIAAIYPLLSTKSDLGDEALVSELEQAIEALLSGGMQRKPKVAKGTRDYLPEQMAIRDKAFTIIRRVFKRHGAVEIDTPVFELKETLTGKYGEDSKLIYDLADQGGELLALRYDLTVPFARFLAVNAVGNIKRFHIGKVYRRDQPQLSKGRYREFYQCDFDIAGVYGRMVPDSECLAVACEILDSLPIGDFGIKLNHRRLLDAILDLCGVPADKFRTICSAVDKLDKEPWSEVRREMVEEKGLSGDVADKIGEFVVLKGKPWDLYNSLMESKSFGNHKGASEAMEDLRILFEYLEAMGKLKFISFDLSLARGLDYYTGVIYEAVCMNGNTQVGSIGGGGRYDTLVSMFQEAGKVTPCVGVSVGIERVFTLMEERLRQEQGGSIKQPNVTVLVASAGDNMLRERMKLTNVLWDANISAEFSQQENPKLKFEIANALDRQIPFMVIVGEEETKQGKCKVKDLNARTEDTVDVSDLVKTLRSKGVVPVGCEFAMEMLNSESD
uniref:Histidine--tRNA ligase, cytoplasmic n=2 Tax=Skeletonema marinoi TaxID=267567 RepID=A0A7S2LH49_9STRA